MTVTYLLFSILLMLCLGAAIAFSLFVIKPLQTRWAIVKARSIVTEGKARSERHLRNIYRMLATSKNDLEASKLWQQLDNMQVLVVKKTRKKSRKKPLQYVAIIPPGGKFADSPELAAAAKEAEKASK